MGQYLDAVPLSPTLGTGILTGRPTWEGGTAERSHVHSALGISTVLQSARSARVQPVEALVSGTECAVLVVRAGSAMPAEVTLAGRSLRATFGIGEGSFMAPGADSRWVVEPDRAGGWFHISFSRKVLDQFAYFDPTPVVTIPHVADRTVSTLVREFFDLTGAHAVPDPVLWQSLGHVLLWRLARLGSKVAPPAPRGGLAPWQARRTTEYIAAHLDRRITLEELAAVARLSPFHFARAFARTVGMPPYRYQRKLRIERACELLAVSDMRIIDVALAVGYESPQALARVFSAARGMSPSQWRRQHAHH